jgi:16S rRNA G966 N2-methylase RsmD
MYRNHTNTIKRNHKRIAFDILFPLPPSRHYKNLMIDDEAVTFVTTPQNSEIISVIIDSQIPKHIQRSDLTILDGTACVGGDSISFGKNFGSVVATEIDHDRFKMLVNNLKEYDLSNVVALNDDCTKIYKRLNFIDIMYFDPPWGGKSYKNEKKLQLSLSNIPIEDIIISIFNKDDHGHTNSSNPSNLINPTVRSDVKMVVFKLPKNYDLYHMYCKTKRSDTTMYLYELNKMNIILIKKNSFS